MTLSWNPPPFEDTNGPIQYYTVRVTEVDTNTTLPARNSFNTQITYTNLHPYYIYRCTVAAYTVGIGPYTQAITVQLAQAGIFTFTNNHSILYIQLKFYLQLPLLLR